MELIKRLMKEEEGQGLVEYALIIGLVSLACVVLVTAVGTDLKKVWTNISTKLKALPDGNS